MTLMAHIFCMRKTRLLIASRWPELNYNYIQYRLSTLTHTHTHTHTHTRTHTHTHKHTQKHKHTHTLPTNKAFKLLPNPPTGKKTFLPARVFNRNSDAISYI